MSWGDAATPILTGLVVGIIMKIFEGRQGKREKELDERETMKEEESYLRTRLLWAIAQLSYATAAAIKRGKPNGEMEGAMAAYEEAKEKYNDFLNRAAMKLKEGKR